MPALIITVVAFLISPIITNFINPVPAAGEINAKATVLVEGRAKLPLDTISKVLLNEMPFSTKSYDSVYLHDYYNKTGAGILSRGLSMAVVDMDGDEVFEVVLQDKDRNSVVFRYENGDVYAHEFDKSEMIFLKNDGTFVWTKGVKDNGYARLRFEGKDAPLKYLPLLHRL